MMVAQVHKDLQGLQVRLEVLEVQDLKVWQDPQALQDQLVLKVHSVEHLSNMILVQLRLIATQVLVK